VNKIIESVTDLERASEPRQRTEWSLAPSELLPLSSAQLGIWFAQQLDPSSAAYNIGEYIEINGAIDPRLFERALRQVVAETDALSVQIVARGEQVAQSVCTGPTWFLPFIDVSGEADPRAAAESWMRSDLGRPIDPTTGPLFGFALFKASPEQYFWYARYHHIVMDAFGMWLVARRLADVYSQLAANKAASERVFGPLSLLVDQDSAYRVSQQFERDREYWLDHLTGGPEPVGLGQRSLLPSSSSLRSTAYLNSVHLDRLRSMTASTRPGPVSVLVASAAILLHRLTGETDVTIGLPAAARSPGLRLIPGMASNVLPLRLAVHPGISLSELAEQSALEIRRGLDHQLYQLADLRRARGGSADDRSLFGLSLNFMRFSYDFCFAGNSLIARNLSLGPVEDLSIAVYDRSDGGPVRIDVDANPACHDLRDVASHQRRFLKLLEAAVSDPQRAIGRLDILGADERHTLIEA